MRGPAVILLVAAGDASAVVPSAKVGCVGRPETGFNLCSHIPFQAACTLDPRCQWKRHIPAFCGPNTESGVGINGCHLLKAKILCEKDPLNLISKTGPRCIWNEEVIDESGPVVPEARVSCVANEGVGINGCRFLKFESICNKDPRCGWKENIPGFCAPTTEGSLNACSLLPFKAACEHDLLNYFTGTKRCVWNDQVTKDEPVVAPTNKFKCVAADGVGINACGAILFENLCRADPRCAWKPYTASYCGPNTEAGVGLNGCKFLKFKFACQKDLLNVITRTNRCIWHEGEEILPTVAPGGSTDDDSDDEIIIPTASSTNSLDPIKTTTVTPTTSTTTTSTTTTSTTTTSTTNTESTTITTTRTPTADPDFSSVQASYTSPHHENSSSPQSIILVAAIALFFW